MTYDSMYSGGEELSLQAQTIIYLLQINNDRCIPYYIAMYFNSLSANILSLAIR